MAFLAQDKGLGPHVLHQAHPVRRLFAFVPLGGLLQIADVMDLDGSIASACFAGAGQNPLFQSGTEFLGSIWFRLGLVPLLPESCERVVCDHFITVHHAYSLRRPVSVRARDNTTVLAKDLANGGPLLLSDGLEHASFMKPSQPMESCGYVRSETVVVVQPVDLRSVFPYYLLHRPIHQVVPGARLLALGTVRYPLADDIRRDTERDASRPATSCLAGEFGYLVSEIPALGPGS